MARIPRARRAGGIAAMPGWRSGFGGWLWRGPGADPAKRCRGCAVCCGARRKWIDPREREGERRTESSGGARRPRATLVLRRRCAVFRWGAVMRIRVGALTRVVGVGTFGRWGMSAPWTSNADVDAGIAAPRRLVDATSEPQMRVARKECANGKRKR